MMAKTQYANPSLWWRLSWQLSIVFVAVVAAVIFGLCVYGATILSPNVALEDHITAVLARSVALDAQGQLEIRDTPELVSLKEQYDGLWYVAAMTNGSSVSYGAIPAAYGELAHLTHLFEGADIRGSAGTDEIASIENVETAIGELRVLFGGVADKGWPVLVLMGAVYPIYVSLLTEGGDTRSLTQVDVESIDAGASADWETSVAVEDEALDCVLRVERYAS
jgi:4-amino-4-deoxy-L-arabinose transferase-like glycosyltransferase